MSGTDPLTGARYPTTTNAVNPPQDIQNAVNDLSDNMFAGPFASASARDTAFTAWVAAGNTMRDGLHCFTSGLGNQTYVGGAWVNDAWTNLSLTSPWTAYVTGGYASPGARRVDSYKAQLRGWITCSTAVTGPLNILSVNLPTYLRPSAQRSLMVPWEDTSFNTGVTRFEIQTGGQILVDRGVGTNTYVLFDNLTYDL